MRVALALAVVLLAAACGGTKTVTVVQTTTVSRTVTTTVSTPATTTTANTAACTAHELSGMFDVVHGSAGAGQITYRLSLKNTGSSACSVSGVPQVLLIGTSGAALPTSPSAEPGQGPGTTVVLQPGDSAAADARFSPDVPGQGDKQPGQCQPTATVIRVTAPGGGTLDAPVQPPTPVCERGSLHFRPFTTASP